MRKSAFLFAILGFLIFISNLPAQNAAGNKVNNRDNPSKKYLRPSLTIIYLDRENDRSKRMEKIVTAFPVPGKFNDHNVAIRSIKVKP